MSRLTMLSTLLITLAVTGCETKPPLRKFHVGDTCVIRTTGERVIVIYMWRYPHNPWSRRWRYQCRVSGLQQRRRDGIFSADTELVRYSLVDFFDFELERAGEE